MKTVSTKFVVFIVTLLVGVGVVVYFVHRRETKPANPKQFAPPVVTPQHNEPNLPPLKQSSAIREIDFKNFTYSNDKLKKPVTVTDGRLWIDYGHLSPKQKERCSISYSVIDVQYWDVNGDGEEDAVIDFAERKAGSSLYVCDKPETKLHYFVYTMQNKELILLQTKTLENVSGDLRLHKYRRLLDE
jgi:hypothetical protein